MATQSLPISQNVVYIWQNVYKIRLSKTPESASYKQILNEISRLKLLPISTLEARTVMKVNLLYENKLYNVCTKKFNIWDKQRRVRMCIS